ncbi:MAG TPA: hypothetical protein VNT30_08460 [Stellaceae bacterium]|nr:hypothetical protein [Stellaceae bacterium]
MFNSTILDVIVGLVFTFLAISLAVSTITEGLSSALNWRANTLLSGIKSLMNDQQFSGLALDLYNHSLVNPLSAGQATGEADLAVKPSYIGSAAFAGALIDAIQKRQAAGASLQQAIDTISDPQIKQGLQRLYTQAGGELDRFHTEVATWFDSSMNRLSGTYKRRVQVVTFAVALLVAGVLNIDALHVAKTLWQQPTLANSISLPGQQTIAVLATLDGLSLPIGWTPATRSARLGDPLSAATMVLGWLIVAVAALFGAPFWFDALQHLVQLRSTGPKPATTG